MEVYELKIDDDNVDEVFAISLVENPAIELDFVYFNKEAIQFAAVNAEKRLVMGPILVPDKKIKRLDGENKMYEVFFKPETVKRLSEMYLEKKYTDKTTLEHTAPVSGVTLVESWIKESKLNDKSNMYGFNVPIGTWMGTFKIANEAIWQDFVKTGKVKGFSIEGLFSHNLVAASAIDLVLDKDIADLDDTEAEIVLAKIKDVIKKKINLETYADYGAGIKNNAKRGIELNEKNNNKCATQTGKVRAQQLANGEALSVETIKRMYSYLSRAETYYDENDMNACGTISYLLWGGKAALSWSRNKLRELGLLEESEGQPSIASTYPGQAASGSISPALLAGEKVSIDYDDTLSTIKGQALAQRLINTGFDVHIVTKRNSNYSAEVYQTAEKVGIAKDKVHFTNGQPKWRTLSRLGISRHYDNNPDEIKSIEDNTAGIRAIKFATINDDSE